VSPGPAGRSRKEAPGGQAPRGSVHLLLGPEEGEKASFIEKIRTDLATKLGEQPEVSRFYPGETRMTEVVLRLRNKTLFARHRLIIVGNAEQVKRAEDVAALVEYLGAPAPDATLLLMSAEFSGGIDRKIVAAVPKERQKIFWEMFDNQKQGWVTGFFRQKRIAIEPDAAEVLEKILLAREAEATQLVAGLLAQFRKLASLKRMLAENYEASEAFPKLRILSKRNQKTYLEGNRRYTAADIETIVRLLAAFDERFRSVRTDLHALLLHLLVYYIVQRAGQGAWRHFP